MEKYYTNKEKKPSTNTSQISCFVSHLSVDDRVDIMDVLARKNEQTPSSENAKPMVAGAFAWRKGDGEDTNPPLVFLVSLALLQVPNFTTNTKGEKGRKQTKNESMVRRKKEKRPRGVKMKRSKCTNSKSWGRKGVTLKQNKKVTNKRCEFALRKMQKYCPPHTHQETKKAFIPEAVANPGTLATS